MFLLADLSGRITFQQYICNINHQLHHRCSTVSSKYRPDYFPLHPEKVYLGPKSTYIQILSRWKWKIDKLIIVDGGEKAAVKEKKRIELLEKQCKSNSKVIV